MKKGAAEWQLLFCFRKAKTSGLAGGVDIEDQSL